MGFVRKVHGSLVKLDANEFIGNQGNIFFDILTGEFRLSDGVTPGGIPLSGDGSYSLPISTAIRLGGVKIGSNITVALDGTISVTAPFSGNYNDLSNIPDPETEMAYAKRVDFVGDTIVYKGEAIPGTLPASANWRIHKLTIGVDGDVIEEWASGNSNYDKVWDNRLSYVYS